MTGEGPAFQADRKQRNALMAHVTELIAEHLEQIREVPVAPEVDSRTIRHHLARYDFAEPLDPYAALDDVAAMLRRWTVHTTHPGYLGLFNPSPAFAGVLGETLTAAFNPQLAAWSHAPAAAEIERHVLRFLGGRLGWNRDQVAGSFTSGGAEANHTSVLLALTRQFPAMAEEGLRALPGQPVIYASSESHLAWLKIVHACGLGRRAARLVPVGQDLRLDVDALVSMIRADRRAGDLPTLVIGTAGTTGAGVVDPLPELAAVASEHDVRLHVDAAWAGAVALSDRLRPTLDGIERADSVTLDTHKWLAMPMGAGTFLCTDPEGLAATFRVSTSYMPSAADSGDTTDPYATSMQWSRRAIGLKLFLTLAIAGRLGYERLIERQVDLGNVMRDRLRQAGWTVVNDTALPVVCFTDRPDSHDIEGQAGRLQAMADQVVAGGRSWISTVRVAGRPALRGCITNFETTPRDIEMLVEDLAAAQRQIP